MDVNGCLITRRMDNSLICRCMNQKDCRFNPLVDCLWDKSCPYLLNGPIETCANQEAFRAAAFRQKEKIAIEQGVFG